MGKKSKNYNKIADYYDKKDVLDEISDKPIDFSLTTQLKKDIISRKSGNKLKIISIKLDPVYIQAIKKIATMKSIPYQTLIRSWLSQNIKKELNIS